MPWLRLWTDILDDPDLHELPDSTCWAWTLMLAAAKKHDKDGALPDLKKLAHWMHRNQSSVAALIEELIAVGLLERNGVTVLVHGWERWQTPTDRTNAARQKRFRESKKSLAGACEPGLRRELIPDSETDSEREQTRENVTPLLRNVSNGVTAPPPAISLRSPEDQTEFNSAVVLLQGSLQTEGVGLELSRRSDLPEIAKIEGWRWLHASRVMGAGAKKRTFDYLLGIARSATRDEFEAYGKSANGKHSAGEIKNPVKFYGNHPGP